TVRVAVVLVPSGAGAAGQGAAASQRLGTREPAELLPLVHDARRAIAQGRERRPAAQSEGADRTNTTHAQGGPRASAGDRVRYADDSCSWIRRTEGKE